MWAGFAVFSVDLNFRHKRAAASLLQFEFRQILGWTALAIFAFATLHGATAQVATTDSSDLMTQAAAARSQNDLPKAIALYSQVVERSPDLPDAWWFLGSLRYAAGEYERARDALSHYVELTPKAGPALALRGLCEFETGQFRESLQDIQRGISSGAANDPRNEQILRYHEALLLTRLGNYDEALKVYTYFAKNNIRNPELMLAIGAAGLHRPFLPQDIAPDDKDLLSSAGEAAYTFLAGNEASAKQAFEELFRGFPQAAYCHFLYGHLLFATDPDSALVQFKQELAVSSSNVDAEVMTGWVLLMEDRPEEASPYAQTAVAKDPENPSAQLVLGRSLLESGDLKGGEEHLKKLLEMDPKNLEAHIALAEAYSKSGHKDEARYERMLCLQLNSDRAATVNP
jgi:tetratricopeptide (TPR) repeat protein